MQRIAWAIGPAMLAKIVDISLLVLHSGLEVIKLEYNFRLKINHNDWLLADTCPPAANHCVLF